MWPTLVRSLVLTVLLFCGCGGHWGGASEVAAQPTTSSSTDTTQGAVLGVPVTRHISPQAYDGNGHVWDIAQDGRGLLYIASSYGLQQYDGARWRYLPTANETTPFAIARDSTGTLYVGAQDEMGYYRPDSLGRLQYRSLMPRVPKTHRPVGDVFHVVAVEEAVFFRTESGVLRWGGGRMQTVTDTTIAGLFACRETAVLQDQNGRLHRIDGTALDPLSEEEAFRDATIIDVIPGRTRGCEVVTEEQGRYAISPSGIERRPLRDGPMDEPVVAAVRGPGGGLAVATEWTVRLVGPDGTRHRLARASGQIPGEIKALYVSSRKALWVATSAGIVRVAWPDPVSLITQPSALQSIPGDILRHEGALMLSTEEGLWRAGRDTTQHLAADGYVYSLLSTRAGLLAAGSDGLFVVRDERTRFLFDEGGVYALHRSPRDSSVAYATLIDGGLLRLRQDAGRWRVADRTDRLGTLVPSVAQSPDGALWLGTGNRGLVRVGAPRAQLDATPIARYDTADGLPSTTFNFVAQLGDSVRFPTDEGLYRFVDGRFEPDSHFEPVYADGVRKSWFAERGPDGGVWIDFGGHKLGVAIGWPGDSLRWRARPYRRVADVGDVWSIYPDGERDSLVWFGAEGALVRYDRRLQHYGGHNQPFRTLVRGVRTRGDSLLYGGDADTSALPGPVAHEHNRLRFQFGGTSYEQIDGPTHNWDRPRQYRWRLEGFDEDWTDWTTEAHTDYTGLPPGRYTMRVEARNLYQVVGSEATLSLRILPPWYRTWWAYGLYALLAVGLVAGAVRGRTRQLRRRQEELEETVAERTEQLRQKNDELARQAEKLKELDEAKSRFFANVSHEFRTPLTLIQGPVQDVRGQLARTDGDLEVEAEQLAIAERNADRLRRLVDQLLALARMDAGTYELAARPTDLGAEVQRIVRSFEPLAERHGLAFRVEVDGGSNGDADPVIVDREALEHILGNLLSNAIKFTPEGGHVTVTVTESADHAAIAVADTGPGIPEERQTAVFERFQQGDEKPSGDRTGVGIGLAFTKDLVDLHGGTIALDSTEGDGTTVTVRLLRGSDHLADDQVAAPRPADEPGPTGTAESRQEPSSDISESSLDSRFSSPSETAAPPSPLPSPASDGGSTAEKGTATDDQSPIQTPKSKIVLVVDDNADVRRYVRSILAPVYTVIEAADGEEGLARARETMPDCILADVMMPTMDGVAMTRHLKADRATDYIPVVMLTARAGTEHEIEGLEAGADDYVTKPFDADVLRARVAGMIEVRRRLRHRVRAEMERRSGDGSADGGPVDDRPGAVGDRAPDATPPRLVVSTADEDEPEFVRTVRAAIEERLADPTLSVEQLASAVAVSRSTLYRRLKAQVGASPSQFMQKVRVEHGARLLREEEGTISEVAYAVGFDTLSYFSRQFREHFGQSPSEYVEKVG